MSTQKSEKPKEYCVFHNHSTGSLLDGISQIDDIIGRLDEIGVNSCGISDHGNLLMSVEFLKAMTKAKKKPILGIEFYICNLHSKIKNETNRSLSHLLIYAKNDNGWKNLVKLTSEANRSENYYYKPRLSLDQILPYKEDLVICTGHMGSTLGNILLEDNDLENGYKHIKYLVDNFGKENVYLEVQLLDTYAIPQMKTLADMIRKLSVKTGVKCLASTDCHYVRQEDAEDQRIVLCRNLGSKTLEQVRSSGTFSGFFNSNHFYIPSYNDLIEWGNTPEELANTLEFAEHFNEYKNILKPPTLPVFECPLDKSGKPYTPEEYLTELCRDGWRSKIMHIIPKEEQQQYVDRIKYELGVINGANLASYFLIVKDILDYVTNKGWLKGPGRGSAAGCLVSYLIGITQINPIPYYLLFERFLNEGRLRKDKNSLADIDIDIPAEKRNEVIKYIQDKYGKEHVSKIVTLNTMQGRSSIKDVLRAYGYSFEEMNNITKHIPDKAAISDDLQEMKDSTGESSIIRWALENKSKDLKEWCYIEDGELRGPLAKRFEQAIRLENTRTGASIHAAGIIVSPQKIADVCPLIHDDKNENNMIAGLEGPSLESIGCIKFDLLALNLLDKLMEVSTILSTTPIKEEK